MTQNTETANGNQLQNGTTVNNSMGINMNSQQQQQQMQPYPDPPYSVRHSRAFRHFKNPPQPHMCIKDHTHDGQEVSAILIIQSENKNLTNKKKKNNENSQICVITEIICLLYIHSKVVLLSIYSSTSM